MGVGAVSFYVVEIMDGDECLLSATSLPNSGRNSEWKLHDVANPEIKKRKGVVLVTICFAFSGALSFAYYYTGIEHITLGDYAKYESTFLRSGRHLSGISFVRQHNSESYTWL